MYLTTLAVQTCSHFWQNQYTGGFFLCFKVDNLSDFEKCKKCAVDFFLPSSFPSSFTPSGGQQVEFESRSLLCSLWWWFDVVGGIPNVTVTLCVWCYCEGKQPGARAPPPPPARSHLLGFVFTDVASVCHVCLKIPEVPNTWCLFTVSVCLAKLTVALSLAFPELEDKLSLRSSETAKGHFCFDQQSKRIWADLVSRTQIHLCEFLFCLSIWHKNCRQFLSYLKHKINISDENIRELQRKYE